jgi:hypothetical protein
LVVFEAAGTSGPVVRTSHARKICRRLGQRVGSAIVLCRSITEEARAELEAAGATVRAVHPWFWTEDSYQRVKYPTKEDKGRRRRL